MLFKKKKTGCQHIKTPVTKVIEKEKVWFRCEKCGQEITTWKRKAVNIWVRYKTWKGAGYGLTSYLKEFLLAIVQGGVIMTTFKVMWNIDIPWQIIPILFVAEEIIDVVLGWFLIYKVRLQEAEVDYTSRTQEMNPVSRNILDDLEQIKEDNAEILEKLTKKNENQD